MLYNLKKIIQKYRKFQKIFGEVLNCVNSSLYQSKYVSMKSMRFWYDYHYNMMNKSNLSSQLSLIFNISDQKNKIIMFLIVFCLNFFQIPLAFIKIYFIRIKNSLFWNIINISYGQKNKKSDD